ncbi:MAG: alpha/beta fold hydrolase [Anaerotignaceae bacterium]
MNFKKTLKIFGIISATLGGIAVVNKGIFFFAQKKDKEFQYGETYSWKHGRVHYKKVGTGKPIILLHSLFAGASHREYEKNISILARRYTVYAIDLIGYGYSEKPKMTYTAFIYASFINSFIEDVVKEPVSIIGANGAASFAVVVAKLFPKNVNKLLLISPSGIKDTLAQNEDYYKRIGLELPIKGSATYTNAVSKASIKKFLTKEGFFAKDKVTQEVINSFYYGAHGTNSDARFAYASQATNYMNIDIKGYIKDLDIPITIVWGEENTLNPMENLEIIKGLKEGFDIFIFEKTKSLPHYENYEEFNKVVAMSFR